MVQRAVVAALVQVRGGTHRPGSLTLPHQSEQALERAQIRCDAQINFLDAEGGLICAASDVTSCGQVNARAYAVPCADANRPDLSARPHLPRHLQCLHQSCKLQSAGRHTTQQNVIPR